MKGWREIKQTLNSHVRNECCNLVSDECLGTNVNGNRLKRNSKTTIIYQYPYELEYKNAGLCWVQEGVTCDYFERFVLPGNGNKAAIAKEYKKCVSGIKKQKLRFCECGAVLAKGARYCEKCRKKKKLESKRRYWHKQKV